jgi:hypothetical protein
MVEVVVVVVDGGPQWLASGAWFVPEPVPLGMLVDQLRAASAWLHDQADELERTDAA